MGRLPTYAWAWPKGGRSLLLQAAALPDLEAAGQAFRLWLEQNDFDDVTFAEQRLLVTISSRLPADVLNGPARARLKGIERMLWTQSRLSLHAAKPALAVLGEMGIPIMVLKGAARAALDMGDLRGRFASDVDLLVPRAHFDTAYRKLLGAGWNHGQPSEPDLSKLIGLNLRHGAHGDLDLHKYPIHQLVAGDADLADLWTRSQTGQLLGHAVHIPSATDRLVMAIAHGGIDAHQHSDLMVDCAVLIQQGDVDWPLFERLCAERGLEAHASIALSYLSEMLDAKTPGDNLSRLIANGRANGPRLWSALLQARPKRDHSPLSAVGRGIARGHRQVQKALMLRELERRS